MADRRCAHLPPGGRTCRRLGSFPRSEWNCMSMSMPQADVPRVGTGKNRRQSSTEWERCCSRCKEWKPENTDVFSTKRQAGHVYYSWCRDCARECARDRMRARRSDAVEKERVRDEHERHARSSQGLAWKRRRSYLDNSIRRAPHLVHDLRPDEWERIIDAFSGACAYCRQSSGRLEADHVIPLSDPGCPGTVVGNLVPACAPCNRSKRRKRLDEWRPEVVEYVLSVLHSHETPNLA